MASRPWLDQLTRELTERKIPAGLQQRLLEELRDHWDDLMEEERSMSTTGLKPEQRLGLPAQIATVAATEYQRAGFFKRHPILTFVVAPLPVAVVALLAFMLVMAGLGWVSGATQELEGRQAGVPLSATAVTLLEMTRQGMRFVPFGVAALLFVWLGIRSGVRLPWCLTACGLIALLAGAFFASVEIPIDGSKGSLSLGLGFPFGQPQYFQLAVPLAIGLCAACGVALRRRAAA